MYVSHETNERIYTITTQSQSHHSPLEMYKTARPGPARDQRWNWVTDPVGHIFANMDLGHWV